MMRKMGNINGGSFRQYRGAAGRIDAAAQPAVSWLLEQEGRMGLKHRGPPQLIWSHRHRAI